MVNKQQIPDRTIVCPLPFHRITVCLMLLTSSLFVFTLSFFTCFFLVSLVRFIVSVLRLFQYSHCKHTCCPVDLFCVGMKVRQYLLTEKPTAELWKVLEIQDMIFQLLVIRNHLCICECKYKIHNKIHNIPL